LINISQGVAGFSAKLVFGNNSLLHQDTERLPQGVLLKSLEAEERERLLAAILAVLEDGLARERTRDGGLSQNKLGEHFTVHGKAGLPCPVCGDDLKRVSYESHEVVYCPHCQTGGKVLADRRLSRLIK
jgi:formamidopyrimidine-DNA glycosylase